MVLINYFQKFITTTIIKGYSCFALEGSVCQCSFLTHHFYHLSNFNHYLDKRRVIWGLFLSSWKSGCSADAYIEYALLTLML